MKLPEKTVEKGAAKRGKQDPMALSHKTHIGAYQAHKLEGKVKNVGIKNVGHQRRKSKESV